MSKQDEIAEANAVERAAWIQKCSAEKVLKLAWAKYNEAAYRLRRLGEL